MTVLSFWGNIGVTIEVETVYQQLKGLAPLKAMASNVPVSAYTTRCIG